MVDVVFSNQAYRLEDEESVLLGLQRHGVTIPSSCRSGVCQSCMVQAVKGELPAAAQKGLKSTLQKQGYFLACMCKPASDLEIALPGDDVRRHYQVKVLEKQFLSDDIFRLRLSRDANFNYYAGQFIALHHPNGLIRSYSLASIDSDEFLELHIRHLPDGLVSGWLRNSVQVSDTLKIDAAVGDCFYIDDAPHSNLLLIGTGTGLAPLFGIIREALHKGHSGDIYLYHGSHQRSGLYMDDALNALSAKYPNFHYRACVSGVEEAGHNVAHGRAHEIALKSHPVLKGWKVYLCGHPDMVATSKKKAFLAGASLSEIYSDPFVISS